MKLSKKWSSRAWQEYIDWQLEDRKTVKRINDLIKSVERDGVLEGIGKPEALKHNLQCRGGSVAVSTKKTDSYIG